MLDVFFFQPIGELSWHTYALDLGAGNSSSLNLQDEQQQQD
jgi:hypothetical protein